MKAAEIAARIHAHLKRFAADPKINKERTYTKDGKEYFRGRPFYYAGAHASGRWVWVVYVTYQGGHALSKQDAERYLVWLDAGNVGRHFEALR